MSEKEIFLPSFVLRSSYRREIFFKISEKKIISQRDLLLQTNHKYRSHVSRTLKELSDAGIISCKNPQDKQFKFYELSSKGKKLKEEISSYYQ